MKNTPEFLFFFCIEQSFSIQKSVSKVFLGALTFLQMKSLFYKKVSGTHSSICILPMEFQRGNQVSILNVTYGGELLCLWIFILTLLPLDSLHDNLYVCDVSPWRKGNSHLLDGQSYAKIPEVEQLTFIGDGKMAATLDSPLNFFDLTLTILYHLRKTKDTSG